MVTAVAPLERLAVHCRPACAGKDWLFRFRRLFGGRKLVVETPAAKLKLDCSVDRLLFSVSPDEHLLF